MKRLRIGYVPLSDAAVLIAAATRGFAEAEGLSIELVREVSWANIRDKLILGHFDAAHMLAPFAIATSLGLGHLKVPLIAPFALNLNGNAITISSLIHAQMTGEIGRVPESAAESAKALAAVIRRRKADKQEPLAFGIVFPFSTHAYLLRHWLRSGGIDPDRDVNLVVVPPPYMAESLRTGLLHGFCVGSPWNSLAVDAGVGCIAALGVDIAKHAPEKILAVPEAFAEQNPDVMSRLIRGARAAARWCADEKNRADLASLLAIARPSRASRTHHPRHARRKPRPRCCWASPRACGLPGVGARYHEPARSAAREMALHRDGGSEANGVQQGCIRGCGLGLQTRAL